MSPPAVAPVTSSARTPAARRAGARGAIIGAIAGVVVLAPGLPRGFVLRYDMVFVPDPSITAATLGLDGRVPRAVPNDLAVALLSSIAPSDIVQKLLLLAAFVLAASGAARLVAAAGAGVFGQCLSALLIVWNPFVLERLAIGHWNFILGLAVMPWAVAAAADVRAGGRRSALRLSAWLLVVAWCGSTPALMVLVSAMAVAAWPGGGTSGRDRYRALALPAAVGVLANAVWWWPSVMLPGALPVDPEGVELFAARADTPLGILGSVLTLGALWNPATWPPERGVVLLPLAALLAVLVVVLASWKRIARWSNGAGGALIAVAVAGLGVGVLPSLPVVGRLWSDLILAVPGLGVLRDSQKALTPAVLVVALAGGLAADTAWRGPRAWRPVAGLALVPVVVLPSLGWGLAGDLVAVSYPAEWSQVRAVVGESQSGGDVASFPWGAYRRFAWNGDRVVLDPLPRYLDRVVVVDDDLSVSGRSVEGEDPRAARIDVAVDSDEPLAPVLRDEGVSIAVVHLPSAGASDVIDRLDGRRLHAGEEFLVLDLGPAQARSAPPWTRAIGLVALMTVSALTGVALIASTVLGCYPRARRWAARERWAMMRGEQGQALMLVVAAVAGAVLAALGSYALVASQTSSSSDPIEEPLINYDSP